MALMIPIRPLLHLTLLLLLTQLAHSVLVPETKNHAKAEPKPRAMSIYIVHADPLAKPAHFTTHGHWYTSMVASAASPSTNSSSRVLYVYDTVMHGFAAELTADQAQRLGNTTGVAGVYKNRVVSLQTTRSPEFLGLDTDFGVWPDTEFGDGIVIGFVDSCIWPESASFSDAGLGPVRSTWKGRCEDGGERFSSNMCNNKLVGARYFLTDMLIAEDEFESPRDSLGHGTHVASTAAGAAVPNTGLFGFANGTARGVAPRARVAMYKACGLSGCYLASILAAVDAAVKDGVDILSLLILLFDLLDFHDDPMSIALFGAVRAGVFVACCAGNNGTKESSVVNVAPWITTVGATSVDRVFPVFVTLGDGQVLVGQSLYAQKANRTEPLGLVLSEYNHDLVPDRIMGKVVVCLYDPGVQTSLAVQKAGGAGLLSLHTWDRGMDGLIVRAFTLPSATLSAVESRKLVAYLHSTPYPAASFRFACKTVTGETRAPVVASFSARGPSLIAREILKPDVVSPGLNILAAWPDESSLMPTHDVDPRRSQFNIISGTSMACPHVAGVAALARKRHGDWSPAMVRSAIMTTSTTRDSTGRAIADGGLGGRAATPMALGAGLVQPKLALDPGLVYDAGEQEYVDFLCTLNYTTAQVRRFVPGFAGCTRTLPGGVGGLNYPSFVVAFGNGTDVVRVLERTVTKVSEGAETYTVRVKAPELVAVTVTPATLEFGEGKNEKKSYKVVFKSRSRPKGARGSGKSVMLFGNIVWENDVHKVKSPVVFIWG